MGGYPPGTMVDGIDLLDRVWLDLSVLQRQRGPRARPAQAARQRGLPNVQTPRGLPVGEPHQVDGDERVAEGRRERGDRLEDETCLEDGLRLQRRPILYPLELVQADQRRSGARA